MSYKFGGVLHDDTSRAYHTAVARDWLSAGGQNSRQFVREPFAEETDEDLAGEVLELWDLGRTRIRPPSLVEAFAPIIAPSSALRPSTTTRRPSGAVAVLAYIRPMNRSVPLIAGLKLAAKPNWRASG